MTYSDRIQAMRLFLLENKADPIERMEKPSQYTQEHWLVRGQEVIFRIHVDGNWNAFIPCSHSAEPGKQVESLYRFLDKKRSDWDLIMDMEKMAKTFMDRLQDMPACSSQDCNQNSCTEVRNLRASIDQFLKRITESKKEAHVKS